MTASVVLAAALLVAPAAWSAADEARYACYFAAALFAASLKMPGSLSMPFVFVILGLIELNLTETVLIGGLAIILRAAGQKSTPTRAVDTLSVLLGTLAAALTSQWIYRSQVLQPLELELPVRLAVAVAGSFIAYNLPVALTGLVLEGFSQKRLLDSMCLWSFPYYVIAGTITALYTLTSPFVSWYAAGLLLPLMYLIYRWYGLCIRQLEDQRRLATMVSNLQLRTIETVALAIEAKDQNTHDHLRRVRIYAVEVGKDLGLSEAELEALRAAAVLHDIGKLAVPEHILSKSGRLTPEEFEKMKIHPVVGAEILERARFPYPVARIVRAHHENWDGSGYPEGLKAEKIPAGARILAVVDALDALASERPYRRALPMARAMQEITERSGKDYDPHVVEALGRRYRELEALARDAEPIEPLTRTAWDSATATGAQALEDVAAAPSFPQFLRSIGAAREEVQKLFELAQELGNSLETRDTFAVLSRGLLPLVPYDAMALFLASGDNLLPRFVAGSDAGLCSSLSLVKGSGITGWVVANGKAAVNCDPAREAVSMDAFGCMLSVPLTGRNGIVGALSLYSRKRACYGADHMRLLNAIAPKLSLAIENGLHFKHAESSATTDYLTGLPNAHSLFVHLQREVEVSRYLSAPLGVLVCDLNGFKHINDTQGHLTGNRLLGAVGDALKSRCRENDYVARMGGDEFVIVCSGLTRPTLAARIPEMRSAIREAGDEICGRGLLDSGFGSAVFPEDGTTADELLAVADRFMYQDKIKIKTGSGQLLDAPAVTQIIQ